MKATYLKPTTEMLFLSSSVVMITGSDGTGNKLVDNGGDTNTGGITEGDARRRRDIWEDEEEEEEK